MSNFKNEIDFKIYWGIRLNRHFGNLLAIYKQGLLDAGIKLSRIEKITQLIRDKEKAG